MPPTFQPTSTPDSPFRSMSSFSSQSPTQQSFPAPSSLYEQDLLFDDPGLLEPLYPRAEVSLCAALCAIMQFCSSNRLSYTAIGQLLRLLILICPAGNKLPTNFYRFKYLFKQFVSEHDHKLVPGAILQQEIAIVLKANIHKVTSSVSQF